MKVNIISGGVIEDEFVLNFILKHPADFTIAMEKGYLFLRKHGIKPDLALGDFDSIGENYIDDAKDAGIEVKTFPSVKDF